MFDLNPVETYSYLLKELDKRNIGHVELRESMEHVTSLGNPYYKIYYDKTPPEQIENVCQTLRPYFKGVIIGNDSFTPETGLAAIQKGDADMISFGRLYISNPDLAQRILQGKPLNNNADPKLFFRGGESGYVDYPFYDEWVKTQNK